MKKFLVILPLAMFAMSCGMSIPAGHRGVYFNFRTGTDLNRTMGEGFHFLAPWNSIYTYDVRLHEIRQSMKILAADQLNLKVDVSLQYRLIPDNVAKLHVKLGKDYERVALIPTLRNVVREMVTKYKSADVYTSREALQMDISKGFREKLKRYDFFVVENVLVRNIDFPSAIERAIERKMAEKQEFERMKYVLQKEQKEAQRKKIEAQGIADFQRIVTVGINENLLKWKAIEATLDLAKSKNAKVVVIGSSKNGLPVILGGQ